MIQKLPKKEDPFKEDIERITKEIRKEEISTITEEEQREQQAHIKKNLPRLEAEISEIINILIEDIKSCDARQILDYFGLLYGLTSSDKIVEDIDSEKNFKSSFILLKVAKQRTLAVQQTPVASVKTSRTLTS